MKQYYLFKTKINVSQHIIKNKNQRSYEILYKWKKWYIFLLNIH